MISQYKKFRQKLETIMDLQQAEAELSLVLEKFSVSKKDIILGKSLKDEDIVKINEILDKRITLRIPIQYILGYGYFMGEKFIVTPDVLIPRSETELLVQEVCKLKGQRVLDIGAGSGCIAIMVKKLSDKEVVSCDISCEALEIAKKNAEKLCAKVDFIHSNLYENISGMFDIIVSNPPYIPDSQYHALEPEVKEHEPHLALFAEDAKGIEFYEKIIEGSKKYLKKDGCLAFEIGCGQHNLVKNILEKNDFSEIKIQKDFAGIKRLMIAKNTKKI